MDTHKPNPQAPKCRECKARKQKYVCLECHEEHLGKLADKIRELQGEVLTSHTAQSFLTMLVQEGCAHESGPGKTTA